MLDSSLRRRRRERGSCGFLLRDCLWTLKIADSLRRAVHKLRLRPLVHAVAWRYRLEATVLT